MNALIELSKVMEEIGKTFEDIEYCWFSNVEPGGYDSWTEPKFFLLLHNNEKDEEKAISWLRDYNYDDGYGGQELYGEVVFNDGTWLERGEYDGSEWREYKKIPHKPDVGVFREMEKRYNYENTHSVLDE